MPNNENESKRPLMEVLDDAIKNAMQNASFKDRTINLERYKVLTTVCESLTGILGGEFRVNLHPAFSAGGMTVTVEDISLSADEVSKLRTVLAECSTLSIEPLTNGNLELGVTVPDVFDPLK